MMRHTRLNHLPAFKPKVALAAIKARHHGLNRPTGTGTWVG